MCNTMIPASVISLTSYLILYIKSKFKLNVLETFSNTKCLSLLCMKHLELLNAQEFLRPEKASWKAQIEL